MSFNGWVIIGCVAMLVVGSIYSGLIARESDAEQEAAIRREREAAERNKAMVKQAALTGAKLAGQAVLKMLKK